MNVTKRTLSITFNSLVLLAAAAVLLFDGDEPPAPPTTVTITNGEEARRAEPLAALSQETRVEAVELALPSSSTNALPAANAETDSGPLVLRGRVLEGATQLPVAHTDVQLTRLTRMDVAPADDPGRHAKVTVKTDDQGAFELSLDPAAWRVGDSCSVLIEPAPRRRLFFGTVPLQEDLLLLTRTPVELRGRLTTARDLSASEVHVAAHVPATRAMASSIYCGSAEVQADGSFVVRGLVDALPPRFHLSVGVDNQVVAVRPVNTSALTSPEGAEVELVLGDLQCQVVDALGKPVENATVALAPMGPGMDQARITLYTDAEGRASAVVPSGELEACAGKEGYASFTERFAPTWEGEALQRRFVLRELTREDRLTGRVLLADGAPVEGVFVSAEPVAASDDVSAAGFVATHTEADGSFALRLASNARLRLRGYHKQHGFTQEVVLTASVRDVTLHLRETGAVRISADTRWLAGPFQSGVTELVLIDREHESMQALHRWNLPILLEEIGVGEYHVFAYFAGLDGYAQSSLTVRPGELTKLTLAPEPARWIEGRVLAADGTPAARTTVQTGHPDWPEEVARVLGRTETDEQGRFRAFAGTFDTMELVTLRGGEPLTRHSVSSQEPSSQERVEVRLPAEASPGTPKVAALADELQAGSRRGR